MGKGCHTYYFYRGLCKIQLNRYDEAQIDILNSVDFAKQNKVDPHYFELFYLGIIKLEQENYVDAINYFDEALKYYPKYSDCQFYKAKCLYYLGKTKECYDLLLKSKENFVAGNTLQKTTNFTKIIHINLKIGWLMDGLNH